VQYVIGSDRNSFGRGSSFSFMRTGCSSYLDAILETGLFIRIVWLALLIIEIRMDAYVTSNGRIAHDAL
jgi:hypothetical protein